MVCESSSSPKLQENAKFHRSVRLGLNIKKHLKDRVGRSVCDLLWVHLNCNISLNLQGIKTNDI